MSVVEGVFQTYEAYQKEVLSLEQELDNAVLQSQEDTAQKQADVNRQNILNNKLGAVADGVQGN